jgi:hypothetical protein
MLAFILLYLVLSLMSSRIFVHLFYLVRIDNEDFKGKTTVSGELGLKAEWSRGSAFFLMIFRQIRRPESVSGKNISGRPHS